MECRTCSESLTAYLDQELQSWEQSEIEAHIEQCDSCRAEYDSLVYAFQLVEAVPLKEITPPRWAGIEDNISGYREGFFNFQWLFRPSWAAAATALLLLSLSMPFYYYSTGEQADLERMLAAFVAERDRQEMIHEGIIQMEPVGWFTHNPFVARGANSPRNPFSAE